jgi:ankyrin repeat protein
MDLCRAIIDRDESRVAALLTNRPSLAKESLAIGASRSAASDFYFLQIEHYLYAGDTPLHAAAAAYAPKIADLLIRHGANVSARNRRGAEPLHYAANGNPTLKTWNPEAQVATIAFLIGAGADPNSPDKSGVTALHRAVRQRCSAAVEALLSQGANARLRNKSGSTPLHLAVQTTGRGGSGRPESHAQQERIIQLLLQAGANPQDRDANGKTVKQAVQGERLAAML